MTLLEKISQLINLWQVTKAERDSLKTLLAQKEAELAAANAKLDEVLGFSNSGN